MMTASFLHPALPCLLAVCLAILPVMALPGGNVAAVTLSVSPSQEGAHILGEPVRLSGTNTASNITYLFLTGKGCNPAGSRLEGADPCTAAVRDGEAPTFTAVPVDADGRWSWVWNTSSITLPDGTYAVYAVSSPRDANHLGSAIYDSSSLKVTNYILTAGARPAVADQGDVITISGMATGHPAAGVAIWVIGPEYSDRVVVRPDEKNAFSWALDSSSTHLLNGTYRVFVEHPAANSAFDFDLNGDYLFNNRIRSNIFTFRGNGRLYGDAAYTAFSAALKGPGTDDIIVPLAFTLGTGPVTMGVSTAATLPADTRDPAVNLTKENKTPVVSGTTTGLTETGSLPVTIPIDSTPGTAGNLSGVTGSQAGDNGGYLQRMLPAGILGLILAAAAGGAILLSRRRSPGSDAGDTPQPARFYRHGGNDTTRTGSPADTMTGNVLPGPAPVTVSASPVSPAIAFPEELADKYTDIVPVGSGGFAMVYAAYRASDHRKVAVKIPVRSDERTGKSFLHEIRVWEALHHPNIVEVKATNILPVPYVELEYVPGSLEHLEKPVDIMTAARIVRGIADGIRYAHARRCIHRDIKPQNILLTETLEPKITDWGISKVLEERAKKTTFAGFSLSYAAPEQIAPERFGSTDERTDIWQIGAVFYELVTGSTPFYADGMMELVDEILEEDPIFPSDYNPKAAPVEHIILKCLAKHPALRYQSAADLLAALDDFIKTRDHPGFR